MKPVHDWHHTRLGRTILFLGGIRLAVPVLILVAAALSWGTWLESTRSAQEAGRLVYGSGWFLALMILVCSSLTISVITRWPWQRKHVGFIVVHASLILIIVSGFISFFTRVEGTITLATGERADHLQMQTRHLELLEHDAGQFESIESADITGSDTILIGGAQFTITDRWPNTTEELTVKNDGANPLHAVELVPGTGDPVWIGQTKPGDPSEDLGGVFVRVLPAGESWQPPVQARSLLLRSRDGATIAVPGVGESLAETSWRVESIEQFEHAVVDEHGLSEREGGSANPAARVTLVHEDGSREILVAFGRFRDSVHKQLTNGETHSPYVLAYEGDAGEWPLIAFERAGSTPTITIASGDGETERFTHDGDWPWQVESALVGPFEVLHDYTNARGTTELVRAPAEDNTVPAIVAEYDTHGHSHRVIFPWGQRIPVQVDDEVLMIRYGPKVRALPFAIELTEFRKLDYPGSDMAMAYESDVIFETPEMSPTAMTVWMNNPLKYKGWKVYQSGFVGNTISVFQVARDPGVVPMYIGCIGLCVGIAITFYSRSLSRGHPGIPTPFTARVSDRGQYHVEASDHQSDSVHLAESNGFGNGAVRTGAAGFVECSDSGSRAGDAARNIRESDRDEADRPHEVV